MKYFSLIQICSDNSWTEVFDDEIKAPYAYNGDQWVGYDNVKSIGIKVRLRIILETLRVIEVFHKLNYV